MMFYERSKSIRVMLKAFSEQLTLWSTDDTGAYSSFKRSRLKPLSAQKLQTRRRSVPVFFRNFRFC